VFSCWSTDVKYDPGQDVAGIKWSEDYTDARFTLNVTPGSIAVENL